MSKSRQTAPLANPVTAARESHTPGPWTASRFDRKESVISSRWWTAFAVVYGNSDAMRDKQGRANARLIAAAPDLLAALEATYAVLDAEYGPGVSNGYWPTIAPVLEQARAAIKKARGE